MEIIQPNLIGEDLNKFLEAVLFPSSEEKMMQKAYIQYVKHLEYMRVYREKNREKINQQMKELYLKNPEYRKRAAERFTEKYYPTRYGMNKEEYLKQKEQKEKIILDKAKNTEAATTKKGRLLSYAEFIEKHEKYNSMIYYIISSMGLYNIYFIL